MEDPVVQAAQLAFSVRLKNSSDVSENTKNAQAIAKGWRSAVHALDPDRFQIEAMVTPELDQKIDIVDCFRKAEDIPPVVGEAIMIDARCVWMQLGIVNEAAAAKARANGILVVMDRCLKIEHALGNLHGIL